MCITINQHNEVLSIVIVTKNSILDVEKMARLWLGFINTLNEKSATAFHENKAHTEQLGQHSKLVAIPKPYTENVFISVPKSFLSFIKLEMFVDDLDLFTVVSLLANKQT